MKTFHLSSRVSEDLEFYSRASSDQKEFFQSILQGSIKEVEELEYSKRLLDILVDHMAEIYVAKDFERMKEVSNHCLATIMKHPKRGVEHAERAKLRKVSNEAKT